MNTEKIPCKYLITDCETGGLDDRVNPLLSISLLAADENFKEVDNFELTLKPPVGTVIEVPVASHQDPENKKKHISHYMDVFTGQTFRKDDLDQSRLIINAVAAEINGYVEMKPSGGWDFDSIAKWNAQGVTLESAEHSFRVFVLGSFNHPAVGVAHNADFDSKFVSRYLPQLFAYYFPTWFCTVKAFRLWRQKTGIKGAAKLGDLAQAAGHVQEAAHTSFDDCRSCLAGLRWLNEQHKEAS